MSTAREPRSPTWLSGTAVVYSLACTGLASWWLLDPAAYPLHQSDAPVSLLGYLEPRAGAAVCLGFGLVATIAALRLFNSGGPGAPVGVVAAGAAASFFFIVVAPDIQLLSVLGYAMALLGGPVIAGLLIAGARRHRTNLVVLALIGTAVGVGVATGHIGSPTVEMWGQVRDGFARVGTRPIVVAFLAAGGLILGAATLAALQVQTGRASRERLARLGRGATFVAALGPVPYGLVRLTWATPWPQGLGAGSEQILEGGIRVFGICLGLSALAGSWLTLGLISRWGEVWPSWLPGLRGRPVPVAAAVVPAGLVGVALCGAAVSLVVMAVRDGGPELLLFIPAPVWGPALVLATYAYYLRRTDPVPPEGARPGSPALADPQVAES